MSIQETSQRPEARKPGISSTARMFLILAGIAGIGGVCLLLYGWGVLYGWGDFLADYGEKIGESLITFGLMFGSGTLGLFILLLSGSRAGSKTALVVLGMMAFFEIVVALNTPLQRFGTAIVTSIVFLLLLIVTSIVFLLLLAGSRAGIKTALVVLGMMAAVFFDIVARNIPLPRFGMAIVTSIVFLLLLAGFRAGGKTGLVLWGMGAAVFMGLQLFMTMLITSTGHGANYDKGISGALHLGMTVTCFASLIAYFLLGIWRLKRRREHDAARSPQDLSSQS